LPGDAYKPAQLVVADPNVNDVLAMFQHPHGKPMRVAAGQLTKIVGQDLLYAQLDTLAGSSGAGIRDASGAVLGVHTFGECTSSGGFNGGTRNAAIAKVSKFYRDLLK
jgi:hypothetical protein